MDELMRDMVAFLRRLDKDERERALVLIETQLRRDEESIDPTVSEVFRKLGSA